MSRLTEFIMFVALTMIGLLFVMEAIAEIHINPIEHWTDRVYPVVLSGIGYWFISKAIIIKGGEDE